MLKIRSDSTSRFMSWSVGFSYVEGNCALTPNLAFLGPKTINSVHYNVELEEILVHLLSNLWDTLSLQ